MSIQPRQPNITFAVLKHDAVKNGVVDQIISYLSEQGFHVIYRNIETSTLLTVAQTVKFYYEHVGREFFPALLNCLTLGCVPLILEYSNPNESAVTKLKELMGPVISRNAPRDTIRGRFGGHLFDANAPVADNAVHGASSLISVINEIKIVFPELDAIPSIECGEFPLDQFQVGGDVTINRIKILSQDYDQFNELIKTGAYPNHTLGRAFYTHFKLDQSIIKDEADLRYLYHKDGDDALQLINKLVVFI